MKSWWEWSGKPKIQRLDGRWIVFGAVREISPDPALLTRCAAMVSARFDSFHEAMEYIKAYCRPEISHERA